MMKRFGVMVAALGLLVGLMGIPAFAQEKKDDTKTEATKKGKKGKKNGAKKGGKKKADKKEDKKDKM